MPRAEFSPKVKADAAFRSKGFCEGCGKRLRSGDYNYDHIQADGLGGDNSLSNCQVLCKTCHGTKTHKEDNPRMHKANRQRKAHENRKARKGRPMPGTRASGIRKRMNGDVERW